MAQRAVVHHAGEERFGLRLTGDGRRTQPASVAEPQTGVRDGLEGGRLDVGGDQTDVAEAVDEADALGPATRESGEAGSHALLELEPLRLDAVRAPLPRRRAPAPRRGRRR